MKGDRKFAPLFSVFAIYAWADGDGVWVWNESRRLFSFRSNSSNMRRTFVSRLRSYLANGFDPITGRRKPIILGRGWFKVTDELDVMELCNKSDGCPVYACIQETEGER